jgi:hypothetical protein
MRVISVNAGMPREVLHEECLLRTATFKELKTSNFSRATKAGFPWPTLPGSTPSIGMILPPCAGVVALKALPQGWREYFHDRIEKVTRLTAAM